MCHDMVITVSNNLANNNKFETDLQLVPAVGSRVRFLTKDFIKKYFLLHPTTSASDPPSQIWLARVGKDRVRRL